MGFVMTKRTMGFKIESTPYTAETLTANEYNIAAYNVSYAGDIPMKARKLVRGDFSNDPSVAGKRMLTVNFSVDVYYSGTPATAPNYFACLRACGMKQTTHGSTGVSLVTDSGYSNVPATIEVVEKDEGTTPVQVVIKGRGMMGNPKIVLDNIGEPRRIDYEFKGVLVSITDRAYASILAPSGISTVVPNAVLGASITLFDATVKFNTYTIDLGNDVQVYTDPSKAEGYEGARIVSRNPTLELDPDLELIATRGDYARWTGNTTGTFSEYSENITISAPAVQIVKAYTPGEREGHVTNALSMELKRSAGNDELEILHGSKT
jgi:hypothetical protein